MTVPINYGRRISRRIFIKADLVFSSPVIIGSQDPQDLIDLIILRDPRENKPLLPGSTMAGAIRNYLRERKYGFRSDGSGIDPIPWQNLLMGYAKDQNGEESLLITTDSLSEHKIVSLRDSLSMDPVTQTGEPGGKFDYEILETGASFPIRFKLQLPDEKQNEILQAAALALLGLELGEISFGAKKSRGFGQCQVTNWQIWDFDLSTFEGLRSWLSWDWDNPPLAGTYDSHIENALGVSVSGIDARKRCTITATLAIKDSLQIRSEKGGPKDPDYSHLKSERSGGVQVPILSGPSIAGSLKQRCVAILNTLEHPQKDDLIKKLFGFAEAKTAKASDLQVSEVEIQGINPTEWVQTRIKIDRFLGGAYQSALFDEMPLFPCGDNNVTIKLEIQEPEDREIALLLHALRDLSLADLVIGGESAIGRGTFTGREIEITTQQGLNKDHWIIYQEDQDKLSFAGESDKEGLMRFQSALTEVPDES